MKKQIIFLSLLVVGASSFLGGGKVHADSFLNLGSYQRDCTGTLNDRSCEVSSPRHNQTFNAGDTITYTGWQADEVHAGYDRNRTRHDNAYLASELCQWIGDDVPASSCTRSHFTPRADHTFTYDANDSYGIGAYQACVYCYRPGSKYFENYGRCAASFSITTPGASPGHDLDQGAINENVYVLGIKNMPIDYVHQGGTVYEKCDFSNVQFQVPALADLPSTLRNTIASGGQVMAAVYPIYDMLPHYPESRSVGDGSTGGNMGAIYEHIRITDPNNTPIAYIDPTSPDLAEFSSGGRTITAAQGDIVQLSGRGTDPDVGDSIAIYEWRHGGMDRRGNFRHSCTSGGRVVNSSDLSIDTTTLTTGETYRYYLSVFDSNSARSNNCPYVDVVVSEAPQNQTPTATITAPVTNVTITEGDSIIFTGTGTDPDGSIAAYEWRNGNCNTGTLLSSAQTFSKNDFTVGSHIVYLRVQDNEGAWSTNCPSRIISVNSIPQYQLTVTKNGTGNGMVTSNPSGISCGGTCGAPFSEGSIITLTPTVLGPNQFDGWSGDCSGTGACAVTMDVAKSVTATFSDTSFSGLCGDPSPSGSCSKSLINGSCNPGSVESFSGSGPWTWTCKGSGTGSDASCSEDVCDDSPYREVNP